MLACLECQALVRDQKAMPQILRQVLKSGPEFTGQREMCLDLRVDQVVKTMIAAFQVRKQRGAVEGIERWDP